LQQLAPGPSQLPRPIPYGLVSLWDMMNFALQPLLLALIKLRQEYALASGKPPRSVPSPEDRTELAESLRKVIAPPLRALSIATARVDALEEIAKHGKRDFQPTPLPWSMIALELGALDTDIYHAERAERFYHYPHDRAAKVTTFKKDWGKIWPKSKEVRSEALAAVDCYALDHPTSAVFHSMRVAEHGLRALARSRRITRVRNRPIEWATWQEILKELKKAAEKIESRRVGAKKDADLAFYKGVIADMDSFRVEYRNMVMHVRATYKPLQALQALERVREFMLRVSARLDQNGKPINA
jgi:hypothetical protein